VGDRLVDVTDPARRAATSGIVRAVACIIDLVQAHSSQTLLLVGHKTTTRLLTGVELAATIHDYLMEGLRHEYPWLVDAPIRVILVGHAERMSLIVL
jgi:hypothetical protein